MAHFFFWCPLVAPYRHDPCRVWLVSIRFHHRPSIIVVDAFSARSPAEAGSGVSLAVQPSEVQESNALVRPICIGLHRVHSSVVRAADCRSADPWFESGCALLIASCWSSYVARCFCVCHGVSTRSLAQGVEHIQLHTAKECQVASFNHVLMMGLLYDIYHA